MRLGVRVFDDSLVCSLCQSHLDVYGHHCMCCMGQGHKQVMHTSFPNVVYRLAARAGARPCLEPTNLLPDMPQTRPADVLIVSLPDIQQSSCMETVPQNGFGLRHRISLSKFGCSGSCHYSGDGSG